tara:strand:+ start:1777 stop:3735 length:1959 start_codon:yes stop_codon:yes gene_type:complete
MGLKFKSPLELSGHRAIAHTDAAQVIVVKVITKTAAHPEYGNGSSLGYTIDGVEGAYLEFTPGNTYKFDQSDSSNANHPLRFYEDAAKATAYTTGVTTSGTPGSSGSYTQIIPTTDTPPVLFYQCSAHGLMGSYAKFGTGTIGDTYAINVTQDGGNVDLKLDANSGTDSTVQLTAGSNITLTRNDAQQVTIASTASGLTVQEEGSSLSTAATTLNFTGSAVTASGTGATKTINVTGGDLTIEDEGSALANAGTALNFVGTGVTASGTGATKTITIPGAASGITIQEEGSALATAATTLNFTGTNVTASGTGAVKTINVADSGGGGTSTIQRNTFSGNGSTTQFTLTSAIADEINTQVYVDGVYQSKLNYSTSGTTLTFSTAPPAGSNNIEVVHIASVSINNASTLSKNTFTGDGSTTAFGLSITPTSEDFTFVFIQGVYQEKSTYSITSSTLNFSTAPTSGYSIEVMNIGAVNIQQTNYLANDTFTGNGTLTSFTLVNGAPTHENFTMVFLDGVYQAKAGYSLSGGAIVFSAAPENGTVIEIISISGAGVKTLPPTGINDVKYQVSVISSDTTATAGRVYVLTAALTLTLPALPNIGNSIKISNRSGVATCVLGANGNNIMGSSANLTLDTASASFELIYSDATNGWVIIGQ